MKVIVVGGGKVGYYLAKTLLEHGHTPYLIEKQSSLCNTVANQLDTPVICGDGTTITGLKRAGIEQADALVSVTGKDEDNLIACQLAKKKFNIKKTVAKTNNPKNADAMKQLGVDIVINSTTNISLLLEREVQLDSIKNLMSLNQGEASLVEIEIPQGNKLSGKNLSEIKIPADMVIVTITRSGHLIIPRGNTTIEDGDKITIIAKDSIIHSLNDVFKI